MKTYEQNVAPLWSSSQPQYIELISHKDKPILQMTYHLLQAWMQ